METKIEVMGGLFGVTIGVRNLGTTATTNIRCNISMNGGFLGSINTFREETIDLLEPGAITFKKYPYLGFGPVSVLVQVIPENAGKNAKQVEGFLCGLSFFVLRNQ